MKGSEGERWKVKGWMNERKYRWKDEWMDL